MRSVVLSVSESVEKYCIFVKSILPMLSVVAKVPPVKVASLELRWLANNGICWLLQSVWLVVAVSVLLWLSRALTPNFG